MKRFLLGAALIAVMMPVNGCTSTTTGGVPAPQLTFAQFQTITLNAQSATVTEAFLTPGDPQDVSAQFVLPPAEAVKRYAARRFYANGAGNGMFTIQIEDARVHMTSIDQKNKALKWSGVGKEDEYRLFFQVRVTPKPDGAISAPATIIKMERTLIVPSSATIAEREMKQVQFLEKLMADVDARIMTALDAVPSMRQ